MRVNKKFGCKPLHHQHLPGFTFQPFMQTLYRLSTERYVHMSLHVISYF